MALSLAALLVAFILLALVQMLRSNLHDIHRNLVGALFFSQLVFVIGIAQTENPVRPAAVLGVGGGRPLCGWGCRGSPLPLLSRAGRGLGAAPLLGVQRDCWELWESPAKLGLGSQPESPLSLSWEPCQEGWSLCVRQLVFLLQMLVISWELQSFVKPGALWPEDTLCPWLWPCGRCLPFCNRPGVTAQVHRQQWGTYRMGPELREGLLAGTKRRDRSLLRCRGGPRGT